MQVQLLPWSFVSDCILGDGDAGEQPGGWGRSQPSDAAAQSVHPGSVQQRPAQRPSWTGPVYQPQVRSIIGKLFTCFAIELLFLAKIINKRKMLLFVNSNFVWTSDAWVWKGILSAHPEQPLLPRERMQCWSTCAAASLHEAWTHLMVQQKGSNLFFFQNLSHF